MALFESYERREPQILAVLKEYGISSISSERGRGTTVRVALPGEGGQKHVEHSDGG